MKSRASVTVMVTWVCVKESSNIQSGWREGKVNLRETDKHKITSVHCLYKYTAQGIAQACKVSCPAFERFREMLAVLPEQVKHGGEKQLVVDGDETTE